MRCRIDSPLLWRLGAIIAISMLITCSSGCKFGKKLNTNSTGVVRVITPNDLIKQPNGTYKLKPASPVRSKPVVKSEPVRTNPVTPKPQSAKPTPSKIKVEPAIGETKDFAPTITERNVKFPPKVVESKKPSNIKEKPIEVNVNPAPNHPVEEAKPKAKVKWVELGYFYFIMFLIGVAIWSVYDIYKSRKKSS
jgi:hypothetical protein